MYLRDVLKDSPARHVVEGLSQDMNYYKEAIGCLPRRYGRPRLIHQAHVCAIYEALPLRDDNSRKLCRMRDVAAPHLRALKAMNYEMSGQFVMSILELKLDLTTTFEWQRHSQDSREVPHYPALLEFLDLRAHASENSVCDSNRRCQVAWAVLQPNFPHVQL